MSSMTCFTSETDQISTVLQDSSVGGLSQGVDERCPPHGGISKGHALPSRAEPLGPSPPTACGVTMGQGASSVASFSGGAPASGRQQKKHVHSGLVLSYLSLVSVVLMNMLIAKMGGNVRWIMSVAASWIAGWLAGG